MMKKRKVKKQFVVMLVVGKKLHLLMIWKQRN
jgi:hypothetical protein